MSTSFRRARAGFTLLEVMVSTAIMVIIVLTVVTIASDTLRVYDRAVADLSTQSESRGVLDALENDISTASIRADGHCWMEVVVPGKTPAGVVGVPGVVGNLQAVDHPIMMLFAAPTDRPRWTPGAGRSALRGDVCAIAYRIGQRSPFDAPGDTIQQVYGVYRTIIDPEDTFTDALPLILNSPLSAPKYPWDYWSGSHQFINYSKIPTPGYETRALIDSNIASTTPCWTMDENNFIASNVVAMNLVFWCSSSLPATATAPALKDPCARIPSMLRPVVCVGASGADDKGSLAATSGGWLGLWKTAPLSNNPADSVVRYAPLGAPTIPTPTSTPLASVQPFDYFTSRLRVLSDRIYPDDYKLAPAAGEGLPYLPYSLKAVEVSVTVLTPDGSKELRGLQMINNSQKVPVADFKRIVYMYGRNYTRYIRVLSNGG
jgi:prepilin-type N-terminal cleavage/methylation domain-containing protein